MSLRKVVAKRDSLFVFQPWEFVKISNALKAIFNLSPGIVKMLYQVTTERYFSNWLSPTRVFLHFVSLCFILLRSLLKDSFFKNGEEKKTAKQLPIHTSSVVHSLEHQILPLFVDLVPVLLLRNAIFNWSKVELDFEYILSFSG